MAAKTTVKKTKLSRIPSDFRDNKKFVKHLRVYCPHCRHILNEQTSFENGIIDSVYCINSKCKKGFEQHKKRVGDKYVR